MTELPSEAPLVIVVTLRPERFKDRSQPFRQLCLFRGGESKDYVLDVPRHGRMLNPRQEVRQLLFLIDRQQVRNGAFLIEVERVRNPHPSEVEPFTAERSQPKLQAVAAPKDAQRPKPQGIRQPLNRSATHQRSDEREEAQEQNQAVIRQPP